MARPAKSQSSGESIYHVVAVRMRVTGSGNLQMQLIDLDTVNVQTLVPIAMQSFTNIEPTRLANFQSQRVALSLNVTQINEVFNISRIVIFAKSIAIEYPM